MAQVDYFLKIDAVPGESTDAKHKDEIEVESWSWGATQSGTAAGGGGGGGGAGKVRIQDFNFVARTSKASPVLFLRCASGQHIKQAVLTARKSGGTQAELLTLTMTDLLVSSYQIAGSETADTVPTDQVSLNAAKIELEYKLQKADGSLDAPVKAGWDVQQNVQV
jgi:type VI secretion system secreted protein Hcp